MNNEKNQWKTATAILLPIVLGLLCLNIYLGNDEKITFPTDEGEVAFSSEQVDAMSKAMENEDVFQICSIPQNKCVILSRLPQ